MFKSKINAVLLSALGAIAVLPGAAHATIVDTTDTVHFSVNNSVSDSTANNTATTLSSTATMGTSQINQFDKSTGVLTGVKVNLSSSYTQSTSVTVGNGTSTATGSGTYTASGTGSSAIALQIPSNVTGAAKSQGATVDNCTSHNQNNCGDGATTVAVNDNLATNSSNLNAYVGNGTFTVSELATANSASLTSNTFAKTATTTSKILWTGDLSASYSYLFHASQSFSTGGTQTTLTLDFGNIYLNDLAGNLAFSISNLLGDRVGLNLTGISETGDTNNLFSTSLAVFSNLGAGASNNYTASFLANTVGTFGATYDLTLADAAPDVAYASDTLLSNYGLTLNLKANVLDRPAPPQDDDQGQGQGQSNAVPEPASLALLGLGGLLCGASRKRRKA